MQKPELKSLTDLAVEHRLTYFQVYNAALRGEYGPVVREGRRLYVRWMELGATASENPALSKQAA